jgi:hypothetical protein
MYELTTTGQPVREVPSLACGWHHGLVSGTGHRLSSETNAEVSAALHSQSGQGRGSYNSFDEWSVALRGSAGSVGSRLVTAHEAMHAALNDVTAYGVLLAACAVLSRRGGNQPGNDPGNMLARLVESCRGTHEAFATFESLWTIADANTDLLTGYPRYEGWFKDASGLAPGPDCSQRKELMVQAALLACMQPPVLERLVADTSWSSQAWRPPRMERPDERLSLLHGLLDEGFWSTAWARCREVVPDAVQVENWDRILIAGRRREFDLPDGLQTACTRALYGEVAALLRRHNAPTLDYDGHRRDVRNVVGAVERQGAPIGMVAPSSDERDVVDEVFETWQRERLNIRDAPRHAVLRSFAEVLRSGRMDVVSESLDTRHVFASVRPAGRLLAQFRFDVSDAERLHDAGWDPFLTLRTTTSSGLVELTAIDDPEQMSDLARVLPRRMSAYCNVSLAFLGDDRWLRRWNRSLKHWKVSGLFDLSPSAQFDMWRRDGEKIVFARTALGIGDRQQGSLIVLRVARSPVPLLLACTAVTGDAIERYLATRMSTARRDMSLLERNAGLQVAVSHIFMEEHFVDFDAYPQG